MTKWLSIRNYFFLDTQRRKLSEKVSLRKIISRFIFFFEIFNIFEPFWDNWDIWKDSINVKFSSFSECLTLGLMYLKFKMRKSWRMSHIYDKCLMNHEKAICIKKNKWTKRMLFEIPFYSSRQKKLIKACLFLWHSWDVRTRDAFTAGPCYWFFGTIILVRSVVRRNQYRLVLSPDSDRPWKLSATN